MTKFDYNFERVQTTV